MMFFTRPHGGSCSFRFREGALFWGPQLGWGASFDTAQDKPRLERSAF